MIIVSQFSKKLFQVLNNYTKKKTPINFIPIFISYPLNYYPQLCNSIPDLDLTLNKEEIILKIWIKTYQRVYIN